MFLSVFAFLIAIIILITWHEFGHYWAARLCRVKVLRFSLGFGRVVFKWKNCLGTEFVLSAIPLGGYVRMLDQREAPVLDNEKHLAFDTQPLASRLLIIAAGPIFNFLLAILLYWAILIGGEVSLAPIIGKIQPQTLAEKAGFEPGEELIQIGHRVTHSWQSVHLALLENQSSLPIVARVQKESSLGKKIIREHRIQDFNFKLATSQAFEAWKAFGITPFHPMNPPVIKAILPDSPAAKSGFQVGDRILSMNGQEKNDVMELVEQIRQYPDQTIQFLVERNKKNFLIELTPKLEKDAKTNRLVGIIGVQFNPITWPKQFLRVERYGFFESLGIACEKTGAVIQLTLKLIVHLLVGLLSTDSITGPIGMAAGAGASLILGWQAYFNFLCLMSVSLGVLNLLPIPLLDGGHIVLQLAEAIRRRPFSHTFYLMLFKCGLFVLVSLMALGFYNDFLRLIR